MDISKRFIKSGNLGNLEEEIIEKQILKDGAITQAWKTRNQYF